MVTVPFSKYQQNLKGDNLEFFIKNHAKYLSRMLVEKILGSSVSSLLKLRSTSMRIRRLFSASMSIRVREQPRRYNFCTLIRFEREKILAGRVERGLWDSSRI